MQVSVVCVCPKSDLTKKTSRMAFGFCPNREQAQALAFLNVRSPKFVKKWNEQMLKLGVINTKEASDKRDALLLQAINKGKKLLVKQEKWENFKTEHPCVKLVDSFISKLIGKVTKNK